MSNLTNCNYKRGINTYTIQGTEYNEKVLNVYLNNKFVCYIAKCEVNLDYTAYKDIDTEQICGGLTLKECKESLNRILLTNKKVEIKNTSINLTTSEKKEILSQLIINRVKNNKCILRFIGSDLNSFNYAEIVALMLVSRSNISRPILELLSQNNPFSKEVRTIQYS